MNKIKSLFIGMFPMYAMAVCSYGIYQLATTGMNFVWLGAVLITMPILLFFARVMMFKNMARTTAHFPFLTVLAVVGFIMVAYGYTQATQNTLTTSSNHLGTLLASIGFTFFLLYNFWYSSLDRGTHSALQVGNQLPYFKVTDTSGEVVDTNIFKDKPAIIIFFRGNWCPLCMAQIKEIAASYRELTSYGARVALISPQPEKNTQALAKKFDTSFMFLTDVDNKAAQTLGINMENGLPTGMEMLGYEKDTVYPTVIIAGADGRILYSDFTNNYRIRPEPKEFIKVLDEHALMAWKSA